MSKVLYIILMILGMMLLVSCKEEMPIRIGVVGTMSGLSSDLAVSGRRGVEMAVEEINNNGGLMGRQVEIVVKDDLNDPARSSAIVEEFVAEGIEIVIGTYTSGMMLACIDQVNASEILYVSPTVSADVLTGIDDHFIRFIASTKEQSRVLGRQAQINGDSNFITIMDSKNLGFNQSLFDDFRNEIETQGGQLVDQVLFEDLNDATYKKIMTSLESNSNRINGVFIIANGSDCASVIQQIYKEGIQVGIYLPLWAHTNDLIKRGGEAVEGINIVGAIDVHSTTEAFNQLKDEYFHRYGEEIAFSSMYSYETMMALSEVILQYESDEWKMVKEGLIKKASYNGLQGAYEIDEYGDNNREYIIEKIINSNYQRDEYYEKK